jgi:hypothetical protein
VKWIDFAGAPGSGKSTLLDQRWPPRAIVPDGKAHPAEWRDFLDCTARLLALIDHHPSYAACVSMIKRSFAKMATVSRLPGNQVYMQTGLAQRGLGIGWRLPDPEAVAEYFELMPVSLGVAFLDCDVDTLLRRNIDRGKDRGYMVPAMVAPMHIAIDVLERRGVPFTVIDTRRGIAECAAGLAEFEHYLVHAQCASQPAA